MEPLAAPPSLSARYAIVSEIGRGGMGVVLRARDERLRRDVAIKVLSRGVPAEALRRFRQEARAVAALNHPNVLTVYDWGIADGQAYMVSELLQGLTLHERLGRAIDLAEALNYALQLAAGLQAAHDAGVIHRDLKPENLFITDEGRLKILDFGIAKLPKATDAVRTSDDVVLGTAGYMAPEQVRGEKLDARADIFSFGAILYEMLARKPAFVREAAVDSAYAVLHEEPAPVPVAAVDRIVRRCIAKNAADRYPTVRELAADLRSLASEKPTPSPRR